MKVIAFLALIGLAAAGYAPAHVANTGSSVQSRTQDSVGNYAFSYNENHATGGTSRKESGNAYGQVVGSYSLGIIDGRQRTVNYVADPVNGFRAQVITNEPGTAPTAEQVAVAKSLAPVAAAPIAAAPLASYSAPLASYSAPLAAPAISYSAPLVQKTVVAAPSYGYSAPALSYGYSAPIVQKAVVAAPVASYSYSTPVVHSAPLVQKIAAPAYGYSAPALSYGYSAPIVQKAVVAAPVASYSYSTPIVHSAPLVQKIAAAPIVQQHAW